MLWRPGFVPVLNDDHATGDPGVLLPPRTR